MLPLKWYYTPNGRFYVKESPAYLASHWVWYLNSFRVLMLFPKYRSISENDTHWGKLLIFGELNLDLYQYLYAQPDRKLTFLFKYPWISPVYIIIQKRDTGLLLRLVKQCVPTLKKNKSENKLQVMLVGLDNPNNWKFLKRDFCTLQTNPKANAISQSVAMLNKKNILFISFQQGIDQNALISSKRKSSV